MPLASSTVMIAKGNASRVGADDHGVAYLSKRLVSGNKPLIGQLVEMHITEAELVEMLAAIREPRNQPHPFMPPTDSSYKRWCWCGRAEDAYVHASDEERAAFDAQRSA